jgi:leucyl-tRNA synthetase
MQKNWIGKSTGVEVKFQIVGGGEFSIFTTCIETIYGITFMVLAPDGEIVKGLMDRIENRDEVQAYIDETLKKNDMDRTELNKTKSGCELKGVHCINPVNGKEVRMFIGDFVLASYGTGAVMAVPSHDQRDFEYAIAHNIDMIQVIDGDEKLGIAFLENFVDGFFRKAVAVRAFGDVHVRFDTEIAQGVVHDGGRANTVGVVIAEYRYRPALVAGLGD